MDFEKEFIRLRKTGASNTQSGKLSFAQALLGDSAWFLNELPEFVSEGTELTPPLSAPAPSKPVLSEKEHVLESMDKFVTKATEDKPVGKKIIKLDHGHVEKKQDDSAKIPLTKNSTDEYASQLEGIEVLSGDFSNVKCVFLGDTPHTGDDDLLMKMIQAMKLQTGEYLRMPLENISQSSDEFADLCIGLRKVDPVVVITMGAIATNVMLGKKERLSRVHGVTSDKTVEFKDGVVWSYKMVPIFHPDFLKINPKMKRTAWDDLQKVMRMIGKI
ncbi:MAG: hypothetical protein EP319_18000 [Deltaproteobacteria bacterium]|nr:MAG: hypothetical protein EP319_18000 [Deltaproteobacteria bacterium]